MTYIRKTICPYDCPASCGLLAETDGERMFQVKGDPEHPMTHGLICSKMQHYEKSVHSPKRILTPLKRVGKKGAGEFEAISWEEAADTITGRWKEMIAQDGPDVILPIFYSGVMSMIQRKCADAFFNRMGACEVEQTLCSSAKGAGYEAVMGKTGCLEPRELKDSDLILVWGSNVRATRIHTMPLLAQARKDGKKVILIESCALDMAPYCDETVLIRPGTDGALALGMMHVLVRDGLADERFLTEFADGYDRFKHTLGQYDPQWVQAVTGVPAAVTERLAKLFAAADAPAILLGSGPSRHGNGGMGTRLITILSAFTGAWGKPGGGLCGCNPGNGNYVDITRVTRPDFRRRPGRMININQIGAALTAQTPGEVIRSIYVCGGNPASSVSDQTEILRGLKREDLFTVVHERFLTETASYADIILPATFSVEQSDCYGAYGYCTFGTAYKILEPAGACRSNWNTIRTLAQAMGYEEAYFRRTEEDMIEELLSHPGPGLARVSEVDREVLRSGGVISTPFADHRDFQTASGRIRIVNEELADPVPVYRENYGGEEPLRLISVPAFHTLNSIFQEREDLLEHRGPACLLLNPADAAERGIRDGDRITAENDLAAVEFIAGVTELVAPGTAAAPGLYDAGLTGGGLSVNALHHGRISDLGKATTMNDNRVDVYLTKLSK